MYCPNCGVETETEIRDKIETLPVRGDDICVRSRVRFCTKCGEEIWDDQLDADNLLNAFAEYRSKHGLLQPTEIRQIREKYNLSQTSFARILGLGDKSITRYENGSIADMAQNNLILLCQNPTNFEELLERNKDKLTEAEYDRASNAIHAILHPNMKNNKPIFDISNTISMNFTMSKSWVVRGEVYA